MLVKNLHCEQSVVQHNGAAAISGRQLGRGGACLEITQQLLPVFIFLGSEPAYVLLEGLRGSAQQTASQGMQALLPFHLQATQLLLQNLEGRLGVPPLQILHPPARG
jgi:hypothetical protein